MFYAFLLILLLITSIVLVVAILMQAGKGGGLAANFGGAGSSSDALFGSRQASNILTKASWWAGGMFLGLAFILSLASSGRTGRARSVLDEQFQNVPPPATIPPATQGGGIQGLNLGTGDSGGTAKSQDTATGAGKTPPPGI